MVVPKVQNFFFDKKTDESARRGEGTYRREAAAEEKPWGEKV